MAMDSRGRNRHVSLTFIYTVVVLIGITVGTLSVYERKQVKIKQHFSYSITCEHIVNIQGVSVEQCVDECLSRMRCESVNYIVRYKYCELCANNDTSGTTQTKGSLYINRYEIEQENVSQMCKCSAGQSCHANGLTFQCQTEECGEPPSLGDRTRILGNRRQTGSKIKYYCKVPVTGHRYNHIQSECQENGKWTIPNTRCENAAYQGCYEDRASRVLNGASYSSFDMTHELCETFCIKNAHVYFGLEYHAECFCGDVLPSSTTDQHECRLECKGNQQQICGGHLRLSIYKTIY